MKREKNRKEKKEQENSMPSSQKKHHFAEATGVREALSFLSSSL